MNEVTTLQNALRWIANVLDRLKISYQVAGGLAARCYGATRPVHDIDIYVSGNSMSKLHEELKEYMEHGPVIHRDEHWNIVFMKLSYRGIQIEFGDADRTRYFDSRSGKWIKEEIDFDNPAIKKFEEIKIPVMPKAQLIRYKQRLNREVDRMDLEEIAE